MTWPSTWSSETRSSQALRQACCQRRIEAAILRPTQDCQARTRRPTPGPHQARTRPAPGPNFGMERGFPTSLFQAFCALFGPKESGDEAVTPR